MSRIPPVQCLLTFEALARLRSVTQAAEELCVTPSAVSHRIRQLEQAETARLALGAHFPTTGQTHYWTGNGWSRYDLYPHPLTNVASPFYHRLHIEQLRATRVSDLNHVLAG